MNEILPILAVETSQNSCSSCIYCSEEKIFEQSLDLKYSHAEKLFEVIDAAVLSAGIEISGIRCIAVSAGPGSFTGLRIGMSAAKSIAYALSLPLIPVPTFEAFALQIIETIPADTEFIIANNVNSEEFFYAKLKKSKDSNSYFFLEELQILNRNSLAERVNGSFLFGNALLNLPLKDKSLPRDKIFAAEKGNISAPTAGFTAKWADLFGRKLVTYDYEFLEPNYLKNFIIKNKGKKI
ncbi:MAG TPA: tRNA (adenosine(37)-N6)-threonylcarbamoyltransferase complex dimerization subunit type 1 TsaB [Ignavibacteriaceae bacterium]|nr:tRNA (adenosine(37)-N6)-threonylcarbamoyltransferase complex dimerization subunit type 1 TsaB [Ignavibacteriaceae bacterium]